MCPRSETSELSRVQQCLTDLLSLEDSRAGGTDKWIQEEGLGEQEGMETC